MNHAAPRADDLEYNLRQFYDLAEASPIRLHAAGNAIAFLRHEIARLRFNHPAEGTVRCTCNSYPHTPNCGLDERLVLARAEIERLSEELRRRTTCLD